MRVAIAGAGAVGRSIARELITNGHEVLLIDKAPNAIKPERVPDAEWLLADSCEMSSLEEARLDQCDVVIAATGDDKANLVTSLLAKTESVGSTTRTTSGCSPRPGVSTSTCRPRGSCRPSSRRR
jgi:trk system potassium uptake protein TrkA